MNTILVSVAMEVEIKVLLEKLNSYTTKEIMGFKFYETIINRNKVILMLSKVGLINVSSAITLAIFEYKPNKVINYGIAGVMSKDIHTKDIIIGTTVVNVNSYKTKNLEEGKGSNPNTWELLTFLDGEEDRYIEYNTDNELLEITKNIKYKNGKVIYGKIGSGDVWNREKDRILYLNKKYNIIAEDMEAIGIYTICNKYKIPVISIKIISDNNLIGEEYNRNVGIYLQDYIYEFLSKI